MCHFSTVGMGKKNKTKKHFGTTLRVRLLSAASSASRAAGCCLFISFFVFLTLIKMRRSCCHKKRNSEQSLKKTRWIKRYPAKTHFHHYSVLGAIVTFKNEFPRQRWAAVLMSQLKKSCFVVAVFRGVASYRLIMLHNDITSCILLCTWHSCQQKYEMTLSFFLPELQQKCAQYHHRCSSSVVATLLCRRSKLARSPGSGGQTVLRLRGRDRVFSPLLLSDSSSSHIQFFP